MSSVRRLVQRLYNVFRPDRSERDLAREVTSHLSLLEEEFQRRGMSVEEARVAARRAFGGVEQVKELQREARSILWLDDARRDLRYAFRMLARTPGFAEEAGSRWRSASGPTPRSSASPMPFCYGRYRSRRRIGSLCST